MELKRIKDYLKIDSSEEDDLLLELAATAEKYIERMTGKKNNSDRIYDLCTLYLIEHWYDNRASYQPNQQQEVPHTLNALVNHIALCGEYQ